jgi:hypothetical protein
MDRQAIDVHGRIAFLGHELRAAQDGSKAPMAEGPVLARSVTAGTHGLFLKLGVDRLCHSPAGQSRP